MFGERHFATRDRLADVMGRIAALARDSGADISKALCSDELRSGLGRPYVIAAVGETNSGKSSLLNALFGAELCPVSVLPETRRITLHRWGATAREIDDSPPVLDSRRPVDELRNFHFLDTPGLNSRNPDLHAQVVEALSGADLILIVFPITNPWAACTWNLLSDLPPEVRARAVLVVQQVDQRSPADIPVILGHMRDLANKRVGKLPPIFAISAKEALAAKAGPRDSERLRASGLAILEEFIRSSIDDSPERLGWRERWEYQASRAIRLIEDHNDAQARNLNIQSLFLDDIEREIDGLRERLVSRLPTHLGNVAQIFQSEAGGVSQVLKGRLGAIRSVVRLFVGDRTGPAMEALFATRLQMAVEAVAHIDGSEAVEACRSHWALLGERVRLAIGVELCGDELLEETLSSAKSRFVLRLGRAAREGISNLKVRNQLDKELRLRNVALKSFTFTTLLFLTAAGVCGTFLLPWIPESLCGVAAFFALGGLLAAWTTRGRIIGEFRDRLLNTCDGFANTLREDYEEALRIVFQDYASTLGNIRVHLASEKLALQPRLDRWKDLFLTLKAVEQET